MLKYYKSVYKVYPTKYINVFLILKIKMKIIDLGCGINKYKGAIGIDFFKMPGVDIVLDIEKSKLPFNNSSVDVVYTSHFLEHISNLDRLINEVYRVLKPKGKFIIKVPHVTSIGAFALGHKNFFSYNSFNFYILGKHNMSKYKTKVKFKCLKRKIIFGKKFAFWNYVIEPIANTFLRIFPAMEMYYELECVK